MPAAYAANRTTPAAGDPERELVTTTARNGAMVQPSDATA